MSSIPKNFKLLDDLEQYELMVAAYPEKYAKRDEAGDDLWDEVAEHFEEVTNDPEAVNELLSRIVYLTMPMGSPLTGRASHALGTPKLLKDGSVGMLSAVSRPFIASEASD
ncbi:hypothetical protein [Pseudomonas fulva]|uniref:hypothetical protein n=1 Tax=Pseudomonas fulva TaxID=47880 RepID=UPI0018A98C7F|nr:hypothetical protein [Pseudomonas fulva]MBF8773929.1 hypothetical protein [Pseudomonas fulva]